VRNDIIACNDVRKDLRKDLISDRHMHGEGLLEQGGTEMHDALRH
jgi:hypothetical protein